MNALGCDRKPILFFNSSASDREACFLVMGSGMPCGFLGTADEDAPKIIDGYRVFIGLEQIRAYVDSWKLVHSL